MFCLSFYHVFLFYVFNKPLDIRKPVAPRGLLQNPYLGIICIGCNVSRRTTICMCYRHHSSRTEITTLLLEFWGTQFLFFNKISQSQGIFSIKFLLHVLYFFSNWHSILTISKFCTPFPYVFLSTLFLHFSGIMPIVQESPGGLTNFFSIQYIW